MPPKRPRIVPSQTNISVQDVRDYTTPQGAAMANEEMRRLKMGLQEIQEQQAAAVTQQQAAIAQPPSTSQDEKKPVVSTQYSWNLKADGYTAYKINNNDTVVFRGTNGINVVQTSRTITISGALTAWTLQGDAGSDVVGPPGSVVRVTGVNGVTTAVAAGDPVGTLTIDRPLQVYQRSIAIGGGDTIGLDFHNFDNHKPERHEHQVYFQVQDMGGGVRRVVGWSYKDSGGGGGGGGTDWNASDGTTTVNVGGGDTVNWVGTNGVTVTLNPIGNQFTIDRPLRIRQDGVAVGGQDTTVINFDNATLTKPAGYTDQAWHEVIDDNFGSRTIKTWIAPSSGSYTWNIEASETAGTAAVVSGATVKFTGQNGIVATRASDDITLTFNGEYVPNDPTGDGVLLFGVLIFNNNNTDVASGTKLPYHYGVRKYVDIVHGWNLADPNNFEFQLLDINWDYPAPPQPQVLGLQYFRLGVTTMSGEDFGTRGYPNGSMPTLTEPQYESKVIFRNIPHVFALDANTVRVHATMTLNKPTEMRFRYFLRRLG